jgi:hypothetical protein
MDVLGADKVQDTVKGDRRDLMIQDRLREDHKKKWTELGRILRQI